MWQLKVISLALAIKLTNTLPLNISTVLPDLEDGGVHWALLVAGSKGWNNYRHQADICFAYQMLSKYGIPDERIVVMMYDDIANHKRNPTPGEIISYMDSENMYQHVPKDYNGHAVNPDVFLQVLLGHKEGLDGHGSGKVIGSTSHDHVFVYFAGHGGTGVIGFPDGVSLFANELQRVLRNMYLQRRYAKMLIYIEACDSGSMLERLPNDSNIFGVTSAQANEQSYAWFYDFKRETYIGNFFSSSWISYLELDPIIDKTIKNQVDFAKQMTIHSHVSVFGEMSIEQMKLYEFQGEEAKFRHQGKDFVIPKMDPSDSVDSRMVAVDILMRKYAKASTYQQKEAILNELFAFLAERISIRHIFHSIAEVVVGRNGTTEYFLQNTGKVENYECYKETVTVFQNTCKAFRDSEYVLGHFKIFVNLCNAWFPTGIIAGAIEHVCREHRQH